jgi:gentisate 1,2-dioxygenase
MEVRYFEIDAGGHTTLEKHEHTHLVIPIKGKGACLVGDEVLPLAMHDLVYVPSWAWHQFRADEEEVFGFLCLVKVERDRPTLPTAEELSEIKSNPQVAAFIRHK